MSRRSIYLYEFGPFRLDAAEHLVWRDGETVLLPPKVFDLLLVLIEYHGHLIEKDELLKAVWPDIFVEEVNLSYNESLTMCRSGRRAEITIWASWGKFGETEFVMMRAARSSSMRQIGR